ncbi:MAG: hypothetical protein LGB69_08040, partial [Sulfurovum sp.]|nr:hypothetical protein [Sulfurovum sp.]
EIRSDRNAFKKIIIYRVFSSNVSGLRTSEVDQTCGAATNHPGRWPPLWTGTREEQYVIFAEFGFFEEGQGGCP